MHFTIVDTIMLAMGMTALFAFAFPARTKSKITSVRIIKRADLYPNHTPYTGPIYTRHGRELEATSEARQIQQ